MLSDSLISVYQHSHVCHFVVTNQVVTQFKNSLVGLTEILMSKEPWYLRCIKPNEAKRPGETLCLKIFLDKLIQYNTIQCTMLVSQHKKVDYCGVSHDVRALWFVLQDNLTMCW